MIPAVPNERRAPSAARGPATAVLMASCAGVVDLWAFTSLRGTYAGLATGNLVIIGRAGAEQALTPLVASAVAVASFAFGVAVWSFLWRDEPDAVGAPLAGELLVLTAAATLWTSTAGRPSPARASVMLVLGAIAMGGQSAIGLRLGEATTYMTGTLTTAIETAVSTRHRSRLLVLRQPLALTLGAAAASLVSAHARWATPFPALAALVAALALRPREANRHLREPTRKETP